jgi:hypothetical protein
MVIGQKNDGGLWDEAKFTKVGKYELDGIPKAPKPT